MKNRISSPLAVVACLLGPGSACRHGDDAGVVVAVTSEYAVPAELNRLRVVVTSAATGRMSRREQALGRPGDPTLPARMLVSRARGGASRVRIEVQGWLVRPEGEDLVVARSATVDFPAAGLGALDLPLLAICRHRCLGAGASTCQPDGSCTGDQVQELPIYRPNQPFPDASSRPAADAASRPADAAVADASEADATEADATEADATEADAETEVGPEAGMDAARVQCPPWATCFDFEELKLGDTLPDDRWLTYRNAGGAITIAARPDGTPGRAVHVSTPGPRAGPSALFGFGPASFKDNQIYARAMVWIDSLPAGKWAMARGQGQIPTLPNLGFFNLGGFATTFAVEDFSAAAPAVRNCGLRGGTVPVKRWSCLEWHVGGVPGQSGVMELWVDGVRNEAVHVQGQATPGCYAGAGPPWSTPTFNTLFLGFEVYEDNAARHDLWYDDVAVSAVQPVGCPP